MQYLDELGWDKMSRCLLAIQAAKVSQQVALKLHTKVCRLSKDPVYHTVASTSLGNSLIRCVWVENILIPASFTICITYPLSIKLGLIGIRQAVNSCCWQ